MSGEDTRPVDPSTFGEFGGMHPALNELPSSTRYQTGPGAMAAYLPGGSKYEGAALASLGYEPKPATRKRKVRKGAKAE